MKRLSKKIAPMLGMLVMLALLMSLTACSNKPFKCDICREEKTGKSYKSQVMGEEVTICEDCYKEINGLLGN